MIEALKKLKEPCVVELYSDSKYVIDALEKGWVWGWKKRGLDQIRQKARTERQTSGKRSCLLLQTHQVHYHWVKGH